MVARSFKKCRISNAMDGTEDEILWEEAEDVSTTPVDNEDEDEDVCRPPNTRRVAELVWRQR